MISSYSIKETHLCFNFVNMLQSPFIGFFKVISDLLDGVFCNFHGIIWAIFAQSYNLKDTNNTMMAISNQYLSYHQQYTHFS